MAVTVLVVYLVLLVVDLVEEGPEKSIDQGRMLTSTSENIFSFLT